VAAADNDLAVWHISLPFLRAIDLPMLLWVIDRAMPNTA
jgi:hypothetical protein